MEQPLYIPSAKRQAASHLSQFITKVNRDYQLDLTDYASCYRWSIEQPQPFWQALWDYAQVIAEQPAETILTQADQMPGARWFSGAKLNFAQNLLRYQDERCAIIFQPEQGAVRQYSYAQLHQQVAQLQQQLIDAGVQAGDRVAGWLPNLPEAVIAMLATTALGAIWCACSPDFGVDSVFDRFSQINPKVLLAADGYYFKGRWQDGLAPLVQLQQKLATLEQPISKTIVFSYDGQQLKDHNQAESQLNQHTAYYQYRPEQQQAVQFVCCDFSDPVYILFSSGTTGKPKCIVHSIGGVLLQHLKELLLHTDLQQGEKIFYYTTCSWMMWHWLVSSLAVGATVVLFDGNPMYPDIARLWQLLDEQQVAIFGTSAKYISSCDKAAYRVKDHHQLTALKTILSTGSPLAEQSFDYIYQQVKADVCLSSISGGTDIVSCFALGNPLLPVYRGQLQCIGLGMAVQFYNEQGQAVVGEKGELVCTQPFVSMPLYFWGDADGQKYHRAYFARFPGIWTHGDYGLITPQQGVVILGRSDAVLNPGGVRIGSAEIYRQVEKVPKVVDAVVVGQSWQDCERIVLFVVLAEDGVLTPALADEIRAVIRDNATPRHVPAKIIAVGDIPRTRNGKIMELAVRSMIHHQPIDNQSAIANPESLAYFKDVKALYD